MNKYTCINKAYTGKENVQYKEKNQSSDVGKIAKLCKKLCYHVNA